MGWDLVLLDFQMPGMDGEQVLRHIRNDASTARLPVFMLTSISDSGLARRLMKVGLDGYLTKPIRHSQLVELAHDYLSRSEPTAQAGALSAGQIQRVLNVDDEARKLVLSMRQKPRAASGGQGDVTKYIEMLAEVRNRVNSERVETHWSTLRGFMRAVSCPSLARRECTGPIVWRLESGSPGLLVRVHHGASGMGKMSQSRAFLSNFVRTSCRHIRFCRLFRVL